MRAARGRPAFRPGGQWEGAATRATGAERDSGGGGEERVAGRPRPPAESGAPRRALRRRQAAGAPGPRAPAPSSPVLGPRACPLWREGRRRAGPLLPGSALSGPGGAAESPDGPHVGSGSWRAHELLAVTESGTLGLQSERSIEVRRETGRLSEAFEEKRGSAVLFEGAGRLFPVSAALAALWVPLLPRAAGPPRRRVPPGPVLALPLCSFRRV